MLADNNHTQQQKENLRWLSQHCKSAMKLPLGSSTQQKFFIPATRSSDFLKCGMVQSARRQYYDRLKSNFPNGVRANNSLQRTTPAPHSGIAACNRSNGLLQVSVKSVIMLLCRVAGASGKPSLGLVLPLSSSVRQREHVQEDRMNQIRIPVVIIFCLIASAGWKTPTEPSSYLLLHDSPHWRDSVSPEVMEAWKKYRSYYALVEILDTYVDPENHNLKKEDVVKLLGRPDPYPFDKERNFFCYSSQRKVSKPDYAIIQFDISGHVEQIEWVGE